MKKKKISEIPLDDRTLKGSDILLNLREIVVYCNHYSSSCCGGGADFYFDCDTKHGYMEDPNMSGTIKVIESKKVKNAYLLKVRFKREKEL